MAEKEKDQDQAGDEADRDQAPDSDGVKSESESAAKKGEGGAASDEEIDAAARVADALGVGDGEADTGPSEEEAETKQEEATPNRSARRREEAMERRRKRKGAPASAKPNEELPKDKNKRAKELLLRRREAAAEDEKPAQLEAGELVDDALARGWASTTKWLRSNLSVIQWVIAAGLVGVAGFVGYTYFTQKKLGGATNLLASAAFAEAAEVLPEDKRAEEDKELDPSMVFKTVDERSEKALASYREVIAQHAGSGAAILAKLGEAGVLLDKRDWDKAIEAYDSVIKTALAAADADVKGRAIEGIGLAKEGKGDVDAALTEFKRLETIDAKGFKELSQYHQGRLLLGKNNEADRAKAKDLLKTAYDKLKEPSLDKKPMPYLEKSLEQALRSIDPALAPEKESISGVRGNQMSPEEIQARIRKMQEELGKKKGAGDGHGDEH